MVKLRQTSGGSENTKKSLSQSVKLNGSCPAEAGLNLNGSSDHALKISTLNINGGDAGAIKEISLKNGSFSSVVRGLSNIKVPAVNGTTTSNGKIDSELLTNEVFSVNGNSSKKTLVNNIPSVNGKCSNGIQTEEVLAVKRNCDEVEVSLVNGNCNKDNVNFSNGSKTPSESGSSSLSHLSDLLCNEDYSDDDGFTVVVGKKNRNKKIKNHQKRPISNLPPGLSAVNGRRDKGHDKRHGEKVSPTPLSQTIPTQPRNNLSQTIPTHPRNNLSQTIPTQPRNFPAIISSGKSYSSVVSNGHNENSHSKNSGSKISPSTQDIKKFPSSEYPVKDCHSAGVCVSVSQLSTETAKITLTNDIVAISCIQSDSLTNIEMTDGFDQTNCCSNNQEDDKECLPSKEETESERPSSLNDFNVNDTDSVVKTINGLTNEAYLENMASNDNEEDDSKAVYDKENPYCCEFPKEKASQLIGKGGSFKKRVERETGIELWICDHLFNEELSIIQMIGCAEKIEEARKLILRRFPTVQLKQWFGVPENIPLSDQYCPRLPEGISFPVLVTGMLTPDLFWVQLYGHPELHALESLETRMSNHFNSVADAPVVFDPQIGQVVALPTGNGRWVRGEILRTNLNEFVEVKTLDYGASLFILANEIRPMRTEFLSLRFFASSCRLYGVEPIDGNAWPEEALAEFARLCCDPSNPPHAIVISSSGEDQSSDIQYQLQMWGFDHEIENHVDVAVTLIAKGLAKGCGYYESAKLPAELQQ